MQEDKKNITNSDIDLPKLKDLKEENKTLELKPIPTKIKNDSNNIDIKNDEIMQIETTIFIIISTILLIASIILIKEIIKNIEHKSAANEVVEIKSNKEKILTGSYKTTNDSLFTFTEDNNFYWFDNYNELDNNYYSGTYTYTKGLEAINEMGYTEEDIATIFGENIEIDDIYSIKMTPSKVMKNNRDVTKKEIKQNTVWWYILILKDNENAIGYNKTIDARYTLIRK